MALEPGSTLGHYEILSILGAGGMGEVYRARDTKLGREVAVKLLLEAVSADPERLSRFDREARLLAALNHPCVATLFGFEQAGETRFLVMELVEGETLADRIDRGPIASDEAVAIFLQIAEGLLVAHEKGIIHRDLKPANIKVSATGEVKILDFGLAKAMAPQVDGQDAPSASLSPTLTQGATLRGEILGTAAYMSPEQAQGQPVDRQADVWAFGCCLYEALTSRPVFTGDNASMVMANLLTQEPDLEDLPASTPGQIRRLLRRCLSRNLGERLKDIGDAKLELSEAAREPELPVAGASAVPGRSVARTLMMLLVVALVSGWLGSRFSGSPGSEAEVENTPVRSGPERGAECGVRFGSVQPQSHAHPRRQECDLRHR